MCSLFNHEESDNTPLPHIYIYMIIIFVVVVAVAENPIERQLFIQNEAHQVQ